MKKIAVIVAQFDGNTIRRLPEQTPPKNGFHVDFFYLNDTNVKFDSKKELTATQKENFVKLNPHKVAGLSGYVAFVWIDKKIKVTSSDFVNNILEQFKFSGKDFICDDSETSYSVLNNATAIQSMQSVLKLEPKTEKHVLATVALSGTGYEYRIIPNNKSIIGFYHICMVHNWKAVVDEQINELVQYGLMDACESIQIGALGSPENKKVLEKKIAKYPKFSIKYFDTDITKYEFPTLHLIEEECKKNEFYGFYFHTKGVSYNGHSGGTHWRHHMNYYNLELWQHCVDRLKAGANLCGVKLLEKSQKHVNPTHYSGNFFHFRSEYVETCPEVKSLNQKNRFEAEFWVGKGKDRKAVSLCDKFVDYNVQGEFIKPIIGRTVVHTLCFNLPGEVETASNLLYRQNPAKNFEHVIVDLGFPLEKKDVIPKDIEKVKKSNSVRLLRFAKSIGSEYSKATNIGVSQNWETVRKHKKIGDHDVLICADPDERPQHDNWVQAVTEVLLHGEKIAWCSLMYVDHIPVLKDYPHEVKYVYGHKIYLMNSLLGWAQGGFNGAFLNEIGGVPYHPKAPVYGWIEDACYTQMKKRGWRWAIIADYGVEHTECSPLYRAWKTEITSNVKKGQMSFEEWLKSQIQTV